MSSLSTSYAITRLIADGQEMRNNHLPVGFYIMDTASEAKITLVLRLKGC